MSKSNMRSPAAKSISGVGIGLRLQHAEEIISTKPDVPWFEILTDNFFGPGGLHLQQLEKVRESYPLTLHSVGTSLGSTDALDYRYLGKIKNAIERFKPTWFSEHLCWTSHAGQHMHDLLPLPYTQKVAEHVIRQIMEVQEFLGEQILVENVSSYVSFKESEMTEWEFLAQVAERAACFILLDVNNIYVSSKNHEFDPLAYIKGVPRELVKELHLAGYDDRGTYLLDAHNSPVAPPVWELFQEAVWRFGAVPTLIEWDNNIPAFGVLLNEAERAGSVLGENDVTSDRIAAAL